MSEEYQSSLRNLKEVLRKKVKLTGQVKTGIITSVNRDSSGRITHAFATIDGQPDERVIVDHGRVVHKGMTALFERGADPINTQWEIRRVLQTTTTHASADPDLTLPTLVNVYAESSNVKPAQGSTVLADLFVYFDVIRLGTYDIFALGASGVRIQYREAAQSEWRDLIWPSHGAAASLVLNTTPSLTAIATSFTVSVTAADIVDLEYFPQKGYILIDNEVIAYTSIGVASNWTAPTSITFSGLTRGALGTTAATHANGARVFGLSASHIIHDLKVGTVYDFRVASLTAAGDVGPFSTIQTITMNLDDTVPSAPIFGTTGLQLENGHFRLTWSAVTLNTDGSTARDLKGYEIYRYSGPTGGVGTKVAETDGTTVIVPIDYSITNQYFEIKAVDLTGNTSVASSRRTYTTIPTTPTSLTVVKQWTNYTVDWVQPGEFANAPPPSIAYWIVEASQLNDGTGVISIYGNLKNSIAVVSELDSRIAGLPIVYFRVRAVDWLGQQSVSTAWVTNAVLSTAMPAVTNPSVTAAAGRIELNWPNAYTATQKLKIDKFQVFRNTAANDTGQVLVVEGRVDSLTDNNLAQNTNYHYKFKTFFIDGATVTSTWLGPWQAQTDFGDSPFIDTTPPAAPVLGTPTAAIVQEDNKASLALTVTWTAVADADLEDYIITVYPTADTAKKQQVFIPRGTETTTFRGLPAPDFGATVGYTIEARARDKAGNVSTISTTTLTVNPPATTVGTPATPIVYAGFRSIFFRVDPPNTDAGLAGYEWHVGTVSTFTPSAATLVLKGPASSGSHSPGVIGSSTTYYVKVRAFNIWNRYSSYSVVSAGVTLAPIADAYSDIESVHADILKGGSVTTGKLAAGSVIANKLTVGYPRFGMLMNNDFEIAGKDGNGTALNFPESWEKGTETGGAVTYVTTGNETNGKSMRGTHALEFNVTTNDVNLAVEAKVTDFYPVDRREKYAVRGFFKRATTHTYKVGIWAQEYDGSKVAVGAIRELVSSVAAAADWTALTTEYQPAANSVKFVKFFWRMTNGGTGIGVTYVDGLDVRPQLNTSFIEDLAVEKLRAGTLTVDVAISSGQKISADNGNVVIGYDATENFFGLIIKAGSLKLPQGVDFHTGSKAAGTNTYFDFLTNIETEANGLGNAAVRAWGEGSRANTPYIVIYHTGDGADGHAQIDSFFGDLRFGLRQATAKIRLNGNTDVNGDLVVSGAITGATLDTNLVHHRMYIGNASNKAVGLAVGGDLTATNDGTQVNFVVGMLTGKTFRTTTLQLVTTFDAGASVAGQPTWNSSQTLPGLNIGSATGAATGQIRASGQIRATNSAADGVYISETGFVDFLNGLATDALLNSYFHNGTSQDANARFRVVMDGKLEWGAGGATALDTNLYRSAADLLKTDDSLTVAAGLNVGTETGAGTGAVRASGLISTGTYLVVDRNIAIQAASYLRIYRQGVEKWRVGLNASDQFAVMSGATDTPMLTVTGSGFSVAGAGTVTGGLNLGVATGADTGTVRGSVEVSGSAALSILRNTSDTVGSSVGLVLAAQGLSNTGDAYVRFISKENGGAGVEVNWLAGVDTSDSQAFVISRGSAPGTDNVIRLASGGVTVPGGLHVGTATGASTGQIKASAGFEVQASSSLLSTSGPVDLLLGTGTAGSNPTLTLRSGPLSTSKSWTILHRASSSNQLQFNYFDGAVSNTYLDISNIGGLSGPTSLKAIGAGTQLFLGYSTGVLSSLDVASDGTLRLATSGGSSNNLNLAPAGDIILNPTDKDTLPQTNYDINLGSISKKYLTLHASELWVETLVAQDTIATIGGRVLVTPTTALTRDVLTSDTTIYVKHNQMQTGDIVYLQANGKIEWLKVTSAPTQVGSEYSYTVERDKDGTGANAWFAGDAVANTGSSGSGFHDLYSLESVKGSAVDSIFNFDSSLATYSSNHAQSNTFTLFPTTVENNDQVYFGLSGGTWENLHLYLKTAGNYVATLVWEYWNGTAWTTFTPTVTGGNVDNAFKQTGHVAIEWGKASLTGWVSNTVNSVAAFWVRVRINTFTSWTTSPVQGGRRVYRYKAQWGPTHVMWRRGGETPKDIHEIAAFGALNGLYNFSGTELGLAVGRYHATAASSWMGMTDANGIEIYQRNAGTNKRVGHWDASGNVTVGDAAQRNVYITPTSISLRNATTVKMLLDASGITIGDTDATNRNVVITSSNLSLREGATTKLLLDSAGITVGQVAVDKHNILIQDSQVVLRNNVTEILKIAVSGTVPYIKILGAGGGWLELGQNPATQGLIRMPNDQAIIWRNGANTGNIFGVKVNANNEVEFGGGDVNFGAQKIKNAFSAAFTDSVRVTSSGPKFQWYESDSAVDSRMWDFFADGLTFYGRAVNDADTASADWIRVVRSGVAISSVTLPNGTVTVSAGLNVGSVTGASTGEVRANRLTVNINSSTQAWAGFFSNVHTGYNAGVAVGSFTPSMGSIQAYDGAGTNGRNLLLQPYEANVGIGTTNTPASILDVSKNSASGVEYTLPTIRVINTSVATYSFAQMQVAANNGAVKGVFTADGLGTGAVMNAAGAYIGTGTNHPFVLSTNGVERVRILAGGNVGIGTNNPGAPLHVIGDLYTSSQFRATNGTSYTVLYHNATDAIWDVSGGGCRVPGYMKIGTPTAFNAAAGWLTVQGGIQKDGTTYTNPDYVFEQYFSGQIAKFADRPGAVGYQFLSLRETERFVKENWHLPRVGAQIDIFDMADVALEKVEELYIHTFSQQDELDNLNKKIESLEATVAWLTDRVKLLSN